VAVSTPLSVGISTCPNDTFAFHALLAGEIETPGLELELVLADVEELNERMLRGELDAAKVSAHAALALAERVRVLPVGWAIGRGVGPLLLAAPGRPTTLPLPPGARVLAPGRWTTAALLLRLHHPGPAELRLEHVVFSEILPALAAGTADYGACIHEARFTWREHGVGWVADLGALHEERTGAPVPLGGLVAARTLAPERARALRDAVRRSLVWAHAHRERTLPTLQRHAQEHSDEVLWAHVDLYVNASTLELGGEGRAALAALASLARERGSLPPGAVLEVLE
jgi:1,4-dihydroxy-6-naphthoate synthase